MPKILLVDDHEIVRKGMRALLRTREDWSICGEASNGLEALSAAAALKPDVLVLDMSMPGISGLEVTKRLRSLGIEARVVMFTMHDSRSLLTEIRFAGAHGLVYKKDAARDLIVAIEKVLSGEKFFPAN
jgi:DNA-binding NarL/FixJ family response regulator